MYKHICIILIISIILIFICAATNKGKLWGKEEYFQGKKGKKAEQDASQNNPDSNRGYVLSDNISNSIRRDAEGNANHAQRTLHST